LTSRDFLWPLIIGLIFSLFIILPVLAIFFNLTPTDFLNSIKEPLVKEALRLSAFTTVISAIVVILLGTPLAYILSRADFKGKKILDAIIDLPMVLPPSVAGLALLMAFGRRGLLGNYLSFFGIEIPFTTTAVIMAQIFVAAPFFIRSAKSGFSTLDPFMEQASLTLGRTPWQTFFKVSLPLSFPSLFGGAVMTWARALGEFGATIMFAGNLSGITQTLPLAIYTAMEKDLSLALAMAAIMIVFSFMVLFLVKVVLRQA